MATAKFHTISVEAAQELVYSQRVNGRGCLFSVAFARRTDSKDGRRKAGQMEVITGRFGVTSHLASRRDGQEGEGHPCQGRAAYDRYAKGVFCAFIFSRKIGSHTERVGGYRSIPFNTMRWLKLDGVVYKIGAKAPVQH